MKVSYLETLIGVSFKGFLWLVEEGLSPEDPGWTELFRRV